MNNIAFIDHSELLPQSPSNCPYEQLITHYDSKYNAGWFYMKGAPRPCVTHALLDDISAYINTVKKEKAESNGQKYEFLILASDVQGVFNLGGDLSMFTECIETGNREKLLKYAVHCIDIQYMNMTHYNENMTSISLVQGDALGGGFEAALSCNIVIAEKGVKMGLPEVLFNMFPGMGAYSILSRKIGASQAEKMIMSGKVYTAEELYEMGVIDYLAEKGAGELAVYEYIDSTRRINNTFQSMRKVKDICHAIEYQELLDITTEWVDAVFRLTSKDIRMMQRLVNRQNTKVQNL
jgi:DSF synthase